MGTIGTINVALLVLAITQGVKAIFGVEGKANQLTALGVGLVLVGISHGISEGLINPIYVPYIDWAVKAVGGGLSAIGLYEFGKRGRNLYEKLNGKHVLNYNMGLSPNAKAAEAVADAIDITVGKPMKTPE